MEHAPEPPDGTMEPIRLPRDTKAAGLPSGTVLVDVGSTGEAYIKTPTETGRRWLRTGSSTTWGDDDVDWVIRNDRAVLLAPSELRKSGLRPFGGFVIDEVAAMLHGGADHVIAGWVHKDPTNPLPGGTVLAGASGPVYVKDLNMWGGVSGRFWGITGTGKRTTDAAVTELVKGGAVTAIRYGHDGSAGQAETRPAAELPDGTVLAAPNIVCVRIGGMWHVHGSPGAIDARAVDALIQTGAARLLRYGSGEQS